MNVLLLRGLGREARHWGRFPEVLEQRVKNGRVFCLDLPGVGTEAERSSPTTLPAIVADVRARWRHLSDVNPGRWTLVGISFGGMVAMSWCTRHATDFKRAVLVNTSAANLGWPHERITPAAFSSLLRSAVEADPLVRERIVLSVVSNDDARREANAVEWARIARDRPIGWRLVVRQLAAASGFRAPSSLAVPTLVLASKSDRFVAFRCSQRLARRLNASIQVHPTAGHTVEVDDPHWAAERISDWMAAGAGKD